MDNDELLVSLKGKRIGLVACTAIEPAIATALNQARVSFANLQPNSVDPDATELDLFDALILGIVSEPSESNWLRPEVLRNHTRPLLLAGSPDAVYCRETLQGIADDVLLTPFSSGELLFRLHRITEGNPAPLEAIVRTGRPIVLVADDDPNIRNYLEGVLKNLNVDMHSVADGRAALDTARQLLPDLILLDIGLPVMSGLGVLSRLRNDPGTRGLSVILLTASSDPLDVRQGATLGVMDYILKPFGHINLTRKLKAVLQVTCPLSHHHPTI